MWIWQRVGKNWHAARWPLPVPITADETEMYFDSVISWGEATAHDLEEVLREYQDRGRTFVVRYWPE
jgi:hypothetical protein